MSNAQNSVTVLTNLKTFITSVEAGNLRTGVLEIDNETRRIISTNISQFMATVFDNGSRTQQNAVQAQRAAANNGMVPAQDPNYSQLDAFVRSIDAQINVLNNPTSVPRSKQVPLL